MVDDLFNVVKSNKNTKWNGIESRIQQLGWFDLHLFTGNENIWEI